MDLEEFRDARFQELHAVSRKFSGLVVDNAEKFVTELTRVSELQDQLMYATLLCQKERSHMKVAGEGVSKGLNVVRKNQKKQKLQSILNAVMQIEGLSKAEKSLVELLEKQKFHAAIELAKQTTATIVDFSDQGYTIVEDFAGNMQDTYNTIEEHLDLSLAEMCLKLDVAMYEEVLTSYEALGRRHAICDRLGSHFITAIHAVSHSIARENAGLSPRKGLGLTRMREAGGGARQAQFKALCGKLVVDKFENCLIELCEGMCRIMLDYNAIVDRHGKEDAAAAVAGSDGGESGAGEGAALEGADAAAASAAAASRISPREYEQMKFEVHRGRIWQDIQRQVATYMLEIALSKLPLNTFLQLLGHVRRFVSIGEDFSEQKSELLEKVIRQKSLSYFWDSHRRMLETLRDQMNRDAWTGMAVVKDFNIFFLKEFSFLRQQQKSPSKKGHDDGAYSGSEGG